MKSRRNMTLIIAAVALLLTILISNGIKLIRDGRRLDDLRASVLRLHILAESDSEEDQRLKLMVRDKLLEADFFSDCVSLEEAEKTAAEKLPEIVRTAEDVLLENGCASGVTAELADVEFDTRVYGDITMPAGEYRALRVKIGKAEGHNWWCVMYPPLCIPAAETVEEDPSVFSEDELDILCHPKKYRVRFAVWDKLKEIFG
ncbi:MAG: stage II sporulation protein R [Ruminococcus sp.]|nr:stage II sporulation protein R [Ruminococcus sp.]